MPRRKIAITPCAAAKVTGASRSTSAKRTSLPRRLTAHLQKIRRTRRTNQPAQSPTARKLTQNELLNAESALGRTIFGPIPAGHQREFFHYQRNIWLWHESWLDQSGRRRSSTVRYEVRPSGVFKRIGRSAYHKITGSELANFRRATHRYLDLVKEKLYN